MEVAITTGFQSVWASLGRLGKHAYVRHGAFIVGVVVYPLIPLGSQTTGGVPFGTLASKGASPG